MDTIKRKIKNRRLFLKRDAKLHQRLKADYIDNGIATIPCRVSGKDDIISRFSVEKYETLSPEFSEYIETMVGFIPADYPIVLEICGCAFSEEEQKVIRDTVREDYLYELGAVQLDNRRQLLIAFGMLAGMLLTGFLTFFVNGIGNSVIEIIYVFFCFFADMVACYFLIDGFENRIKRLLAGRLADMTLYFSDKYDDSAVTDEDAKSAYEELERMTYSEDK